VAHSASAVHNDHVKSTLGVTPIEALLGYRPILHPDQKVVTNNQMAEQRLETLHQNAHRQCGDHKGGESRSNPEGKFKEGDQVWLEASNLKLPYHTRSWPQTPRTFPCQQGMSPVAYQLALPCHGASMTYFTPLFSYLTGRPPSMDPTSHVHL